MHRIRNPFTDRDRDPRSNPVRATRPSRSNRNPRFAPEFLEDRLSPSTFVLPHAPADVGAYDSTSPITIARDEDPLPTDPNGDPIPDPIGDEPGHDIPS